MYSGVCNKHGKQEGFVAMILQPEKVTSSVHTKYVICPFIRTYTNGLFVYMPVCLLPPAEKKSINNTSTSAVMHPEL